MSHNHHAVLYLDETDNSAGMVFPQLTTDELAFCIFSSKERADRELDELKRYNEATGKNHLQLATVELKVKHATVLASRMIRYNKQKYDLSHIDDLDVGHKVNIIDSPFTKNNIIALLLKPTPDGIMLYPPMEQYHVAPAS